MSIMSEFIDIEEVYGDYYYLDNYEESFVDIWQNCIVLSIISIFPTIINILLLNFLFGCLLNTSLINENSYHLISGFTGIYLINTLVLIEGKFILIECFISAFFIFYFIYFIRKVTNFNSTNLVKFIFIFMLVLCEYYLVKPEIWLQIRGIVMVLAMKLISLSDDVENGKSLNFLQFFGYSLSGANIMFGPWIPFSEYLDFFKKPPKKNSSWIYGIIGALTKSVFFLTVSNCWASYIIPENSNRWLIAYKEAVSFRSSHYFVCYLAELGMIAIGYSNRKSNEFRYIITEPLTIEFPTALAVVVRNWNKPMHDFLKKYIYLAWLKYGKFPAIFMTFFISSLLHGLELKVSVVLVTIGIFSYLQLRPRDKIAEIFDCCIRIRPCKNCNHKYKRSDYRVKLLLICYSFFTIVHLAYLGVLMDSSTEKITIFNKWKNLYFLSHFIMFFNFLLII